MIDEYIRLAAIRDYWISRDLLATAQVRITDIDGVLRENDLLRADAERYRFLRTGQNWPCAFADSDNWEPIIGTELDSVIDAAMEKR